jgi:hypothetical protein
VTWTLAGRDFFVMFLGLVCTWEKLECVEEVMIEEDMADGGREGRPALSF